ncbi:hypothetical protein P8452_56784 [Trifolium repens]|nr:hypothetical protein P8452_56784 [Trifolium repens]
MVDWLVEVTEEYQLVPDTLYLAVNLIDRFLSQCLVTKQRFQLLGITCMLICNKAIQSQVQIHICNKASDSVSSDSSFNLRLFVQPKVQFSFKFNLLHPKLFNLHLHPKIQLQFDQPKLPIQTRLFNISFRFSSNSLINLQNHIQAHDKSNEAWSQFARRISSEWDGFRAGGCAIHDSAFASTPPMTASDIAGIWQGSKDVSTFGTANSRGMGDKAVNQLDKSVNSKLEVTVARQIQARFQTTAKEALQDALKSSFETIVVPAFEMSCKAMFEQQHLELGPTSLAMTLRVWSLVRRFDQPRKYKAFISRCVVRGTLEIGSLREVDVKSGLPATTSTE